MDLGCFIPDTGRLQSIDMRSFARVSAGRKPGRLNPGLELKFVSLPELR